MEKRFDALIIGCGPAGLSAALNLQIRKKSFLILGSKVCSPWLEKAERIDNYLGFPGINGTALRDLFLDHVKKMDISIQSEKVSSIYHLGDFFVAKSGTKEYESKAIIIATGVHIEKPLEGENDYLGRGVSYCATCDGPLYRDKKVALVDFTEEEGWEEATFLSEIVDKIFYYPVKGMKTRTPLSNMEVLQEKPLALEGKDDKLQALVLENSTVPVEGLFIIRETQRADVLLPGLETKQGAIVVDENMATNVPGAFAAGDCTGKPYQLAKAVGQGGIASLSAVSFLDSRRA
ncbi:NAD(P)/FAD-dependent oxidoreductase [Heliorestis convoluta]|uniref:NAD(P)/FAD-dependent oxidoreductase n=1 Tax=Heliorestis convoluta TaxID=356322 RepID=A0A5Q2N1N7_9FIRM|nr:NAD(P)/FAD-dependent oxidoreductase [Heliorestis convoluta]QGG49294.1 NAD(P)/FAD-dependent oxidoreductase [Heliorestis convoluta]